MNASLIIARKRDGNSLTADEIGRFVRGYVADEIPDYQMAALAMAIYLRGMDAEETATLTEVMLHSGRCLESADRTLRVDKHSTGGLGDKSSLILAPLLATCGLKVPMISGRGLGITGGTLDKLESIPGYRTDLTLSEIHDQVERIGCAITGATDDLVPADRKLYALRDVTATISSLPLITASIMSKKLAEQLSALVLDVKFGSGAFMKTKGDAVALAESMVGIGTRLGVTTIALVTDMNQPNGRMVGNAVEVGEALETLAGGGPADLQEVTLALGSEILLAKRLAADSESARRILCERLESGAAAQKFREMVVAQGGDLDAPRPKAPSTSVRAERDGYVTSIDCELLGRAIVEMRGGRKKKGDAIDHSVGLEMQVRLGDRVERGQNLVKLFATATMRDDASRMIQAAIRMGESPSATPALVVERIVG